MSEFADSFARNRYVIWRDLLSAADRTFFYAYAISRTSRMHLDDPAVPGTPSLGGDAVMDRLLLELLPRVEHETHLELFPTYSYFRVYKKGDTLHKHVDRPACEISLSLCLGSEPPQPWPLWIQSESGISAADLAPGDALLYRGIECPHWREPYGGSRLAQVFLHYVDQHGPHAEWRDDKGPPVGGER